MARAYRADGLDRAVPDNPGAAALFYAKTAAAMAPYMRRIDAIKGPARQRARVHELVLLQERMYALWRTFPRIAARAEAVTAARLRIFEHFRAATLGQLERLPLSTTDYRPLQQLALYMRAHHLSTVGQVPQPKQRRLTARARLYLARGSTSPFAALGPGENASARLLQRIKTLGRRDGVGACLP